MSMYCCLFMLCCVLLDRVLADRAGVLARLVPWKVHTSFPLESLLALANNSLLIVITRFDILFFFFFFKKKKFGSAICY